MSDFKVSFSTVYKDYLRNYPKWKVTLFDDGMPRATLHKKDFIPSDWVHQEVVEAIRRIHKVGFPFVTKAMVREQMGHDRKWSTTHFDLAIHGGKCQAKINELREKQRVLQGKDVEATPPPPAPIETPQPGLLGNTPRSKAKLNPFELEALTSVTDALIAGFKADEQYDDAHLSALIDAKNKRDTRRVAEKRQLIRMQDRITGETTDVDEQGLPKPRQISYPDDNVDLIPAFGVVAGIAANAAEPLDSVWNGMANPGNYCYAIGVLQAIKSVCHFDADIFSSLEGQKQGTVGDNLTKLLRLLQYKARSPPIALETMIAFKTNFTDKVLPERFHGFEQQDADDFFIELVGLLFDQTIPDSAKSTTSRVGQAKIALQYPFATQPANAFLFVEKHFACCSNCKTPRGTQEQHFFGLSLPLTGSQDSIDKMLATYFAPYPVKIHCETCGHSEATVTRDMENYPRVLMITIGRFDQELRKVSHPVEVPMELTPRRGKYRLTAAITHLGETLPKGHYTCETLRDDKWWRLDDTVASHCPAIDPKHAYMLFYQAEDPTHVEAPAPPSVTEPTESQDSPMEFENEIRH